MRITGAAAPPAELAPPAGTVAFVAIEPMPLDVTRPDDTTSDALVEAYTAWPGRSARGDTRYCRAAIEEVADPRHRFIEIAPHSNPPAKQLVEWLGAEAGAHGPPADRRRHLSRATGRPHATGIRIALPSRTRRPGLRRARLVHLVCALCCVPLGNAVSADDALADDIATAAQPVAVVAARTTTESGAAAPAASPERPARFAFEYDNDLFAETDRDYTGATRLAWSPAGPHGERTLFTLAQDAWTPDDTDAERPPAGQRPYAGWLYLSAARATILGEGTWARYASIGVLGPSAGAEAVQRFLHEASGSAPVNGWDSERGDRAALQLGLRRDVTAVRRRITAGHELDLGMHAGAALGTVMGYLHAGASLRIGRGTTRTVGPPDTVPGAPDFAAAFAPANARYAHVGIGARAVGRDETLDADTSRAAGVDAEPLVADVRAGVVVAFGRWRVAYTHALRTRTYRTGRATHAFGSLNIALVLR